MRVVIAPDSFKGSLNASEAARAMEEGLRRAWPCASVERVPLADGGEGTAQALVEATGGRLLPLRVTGPLGEPVEAALGILGDGLSAVVEVAAAAGLTQVPPERRDPSVTTSRGVGELIRSALDCGCRRIIVALGGSATNDAGAGMLQALGVSLRDNLGRELRTGGAALVELARIDVSGLDPRLAGIEVVAACDVDNPLCGPEGASAVFGPQKGASGEMVVRLDAALRHFAAVVFEHLGVDVLNLPGGGAAGGIGAAVAAFLGGRLQRGIEIVLDAVGFEERLRGADLVITGEGRLDGQTLRGKVPFGVLQAARARGVPVVAVAGGVSGPLERFYDAGFAAVVDCTPRPMSVEEAMAGGYAHVASAVESVGRLIRAGFLLGRGRRGSGEGLMG